MPLVHEETFRVRFHESDMHKNVRDASYLRYMQEAAFAASAAAGYPEERYVEMRRLWLIRETFLDLRSPLRYGDSVRIKTWVDNFSRVRSRRAYELRRAGSNELVANAHTDWVLIDLDTEWPAVIPDEMIAAFSPDGAVDAAPSRRRFPATPPAPEDAWRQTQTVQWRDLDSVGHVNNAVYADYIEDAARRDLAARGWPVARMAEAGFDIATQTLRIEYLRPALPGEEVVITTWPADPSAAGALRYATVTRAGDLLTQAHIRWGCVDLATRAPAALPDTLVAVKE
ncbi:MAG: thioesterase [Caldilineales bacterium]